MTNRKAIPKSVREKVYNKYAGKCAYCGCTLEYKDMQVDHIVSVWHSKLNGTKINDTIENYMPSCRMCNFYKGGGDIEGLRNRIKTEMMHNLQSNFGYKMAIKYGLVKETNTDIVFFFEKNMETRKLSKTLTEKEK